VHLFEQKKKKRQQSEERGYQPPGFASSRGSQICAACEAKQQHSEYRSGGGLKPKAWHPMQCDAICYIEDIGP
jgi:hypothetical protein